MTTDLLVDIGEEFMVTRNMINYSYDIGLYNDSTDSLSDTSNIGDVTTEPTNANYSRSTSEPFSANDISGNWGIENDNKLTFDFTDVSDGDAADQDIDAVFVLVNFTSTDAGSDDDHLIANFSLSQTRSIGNIDKLEIPASDLEIKVT